AGRSPASTQQFGEILGGGGTGESHHVRAARRTFHQRAQAHSRFLGRYGFVSFDHIDRGSGRAQLFWNHVARDFGSYEHNAFAVDLVAQSLHYRLGNVLLRNHLDLQAMLHDRLLGGRPDGGDLEMLEILASDAKFPNALPHRFDTVCAGENEPVVALDIFQGIVERPVRLRLSDLNERDFDYSCAQAAQAGGKAAGLMAGASDYNTSSGEGTVFVGLAHAWLLALISWPLALSLDLSASAFSSRIPLPATVWAQLTNSRSFHFGCAQGQDDKF